MAKSQWNTITITIPHVKAFEMLLQIILLNTVISYYIYSKTKIEIGALCTTRLILVFEFINL